MEINNIPPGVVSGLEAKHLFDYARANKFAYPAVNVINSNSINAVLEAAAKVNSPVIIQLSYSGASFMLGNGNKLDTFNGHGQAVKGAVSAANYIHSVADIYGVPVILHTDHAARKLLPWIDALLEQSYIRKKEQGKALFTSHMIDLSEESLDENIRVSCNYMKQMHELEIALEFELGCTGGEEDGVDNTEIDNALLYTQPEEVAYAYQNIAKISENFSIAASFGNVHGVYSPGNVMLKPSILKESQIHVSDKFNLPEKYLNFVFHGGSGSSQKHLKEAIDYGVVKVNIDTDLQWASFCGVSEYFSSKSDYLKNQIGNPEGADRPNKKYYDPRVWLRKSEESMAARLIECFEDLNCINRYSS